MTQAEYIRRLTEKLGGLPQERRNEILGDILDHFAEGIGEGMSEESLAEGLGPPETLAREYRATFATERAKHEPSFGNVMRVVWAGIGMGMLNLIFVLPFAAAIFAIWISLLTTGVALGISGLLTALLSLAELIIPLSFVDVAYPLPFIFAGVALAALGALLFIGSLYMGRAIGKSVAHYVQVNIEIISGRRKHNAQEH